MSDLINKQKAIERLEEHRRIFCKNHMEFTILSDKDKARVDEIDNCIATLINLPSAQPDVHERNVGEWDMFDLITSAYYGITMYSKYSKLDNGIVYSRYSCKYMSMDEAIREFLAVIGEDIE